MQKIVLRNPKPIPSWCDSFYVVFISCIPESVQLFFNSLIRPEPSYFVHAQNRPLHTERSSVPSHGSATIDARTIGGSMLIFLWWQLRGRLAAGLRMCDKYGVGTVEQRKKVTAVAFFPARPRPDQRGTNMGQIHKNSRVWNHVIFGL